MATRVGMKPKKEPVNTPAPAEEETILPEITRELEKAVKAETGKVTKRGRKKKTE